MSCYKVVIDPDKMSCYLEPAAEGLDSFASPEGVLEKLKQFDVTYGVDLESIQAAFASDQAPTRLLIAQGQLVQHGLDGRIEMFLDVNPKPQFIPDEQAIRVDFKSSMRLAMVNQGDLLCKLHPPTYGTGGKDITGRELIPRRGLPELLKAGEGVYEENGSYFAARPGRPWLENKVIKVLDILEIAGDVSLETGNITYAGPVVIKGDVPDGFEVRSDSEITVQGTVGDAVLVSGKKITVIGGVLGKEKALLISAGGIEVKFANQAELQAKDEIYVNKDLLHCKVKTLAKVYAKGKIIGGEVSARDGVECAEAGSENGIQTLLRVNFNYETEQIQNELKDLFDRTSKVAAMAQTFLRQKNIAEDKLKMAKDIWQLLKLSESKAVKLNHQIKARLMYDQAREAASRIEIKSKLHPGVRTESPGCFLDVKDSYMGCKILPGPDTGRMKVI